MIATPGTFCEAIVTMYSGIAMLTSAPTVKVGIVSSMRGTSSAGSTDAPSCASETPTTIAAVTKASGTAQRGASRANTSHVSTTGTTPHGLTTMPGDRRETQRQQDAGEHRLRDGRRDARDQASEVRPESGQHDQRADHEEGTDGGGPSALDRSGGGEERGAGRRPGDGDRHPEPPGEDERAEAHHHADGEQTARRLGGRRAHRSEARQHDHERTRESDERGDDAGGDGARDRVRLDDAGHERTASVSG